MKFEKNLLAGEKGDSVLSGLLAGYFSKGGLQTQVNILDRKTLLDAKENPDKHRNLLVRVVGYSAYFVTLPPDLQDEIIQRTALKV